MPTKELAPFSYISPQKNPLFNEVPPTNPATAPLQKFLSLLRYNLFIGVDEMRLKNITVTVSVRVSATVSVSLVLLFLHYCVS